MRLRIKKRMGLPRMYFHVMNRGARKVGIYASEEDRYVFFSLLDRFATKHQVPFISWCLVGNHFHFEPDSEGTPLSRMMHDLESTYARYFNRKHDTKGCLFESRFLSLRVPDLDGLAYVSRYIHLNARDLGATPDGYGWSSCRSYLGMAPVPTWLNPKPIWDHLIEDGWGDTGPEAYRAYLDDAPPPRPKATFSLDQVDDFFIEFIRFLEERTVERLAALAEDATGILPQAVTAWAAVRIHKIPVRLVAGYFGYTNEGTVRNVICDLQKRLDASPALAPRLLEGRRGLARAPKMTKTPG